MRKATHQQQLDVVVAERSQTEVRLLEIKRSLSNLESVAITYPEAYQQVHIWRQGVRNLIQNIKVPVGA